MYTHYYKHCFNRMVFLCEISRIRRSKHLMESVLPSGLHLREYSWFAGLSLRSAAYVRRPLTIAICYDVILFSN